MICTFCGDRDAVQVLGDKGICASCLGIAAIRAKEEYGDLDGSVAIVCRPVSQSVMVSIEKMFPVSAVVPFHPSPGNLLPADVLSGFRTVYLIPPEDPVVAAMMAAVLEVISLLIVVEIEADRDGGFTAITYNPLALCSQALF